MTQHFCDRKRPWSKYKDMILEYYLDPYIPKVNTIGKPILIVDCFAGCGTFRNGEPGSPLIIAPIVLKWRGKGYDVRAEFVEAHPDNFRRLEQCLLPYGEAATARHGTFEAYLPELVGLAKRNTVFLYIDPYSVRGLVFERMREVYDQVRRAGASVELLLNLNVVTFFRWGLSAVQRDADVPPEAAEEADALADNPTEAVGLEPLDAIAGGDYWRAIARDTGWSFREKTERFTREYLRRLTGSFAYAASYDVKEKYGCQVPKYTLIYATRHPDGFELMNDGMCKARAEFLNEQFNANSLFDCTPDGERLDPAQLRRELLEHAARSEPLTRESLRLDVLSRHFCQVPTKDINNAVSDLISSGHLCSSTGKSRINDRVTLTVPPVASGRR